MLQRLLLFVVGLLLLAPAPAQGAKTPVEGTKHPFLWRVEGPSQATCWLFGTMHLGDERLVTLNDKVEAALENSDALYCELEMDKMMKQQTKIMRKMMLPKGESLEDKLPEELYDRLEDFLAARNMPIGRFKRMKVWAMNLTLATVDVPKLGYTKSLDAMLYQDAKSDGLEVGGLETMDSQIAAFAGLKDEQHVEILKASLDYMEKMDKKGKSALAMMLDVYLTGDADKLMKTAAEASGEGNPDVEALMKRVLFDRNIGMADKMDAMMRKNPKKRYFFAVGAAHFPGKGGIVELLEKKGWKITRIAAPPKEEKPASRPASRPKLQKVGR